MSAGVCKTCRKPIDDETRMYCADHRPDRTPRVDKLLANWEADGTCDTPRDAERFQQLVFLAKSLERGERYFMEKAQAAAVDRLTLQRFDWLLEQMTYQRCGPHYGYCLEKLYDGEDPFDAVCRAYEEAMRVEEKDDAYA